MRYIKHYFEGISGIEIYPIISLLIFFVFFSGLIWYVIAMRKSHASKLAGIPLDLHTEDNQDESRIQKS